MMVVFTLYARRSDQVMNNLYHPAQPLQDGLNSAAVDDLVDIFVGRRDDMHGEDGAYAPSGFGGGVHGGLNRTQFTADVDRNKSTIYRGISDDFHVGGLDGRIGRFYSPYESHRLDHPYCLSVSHEPTSAYF